MEIKGTRGILLIYLFKSGVNARKYFRIVSNLLDILEIAGSCRFNVQNIIHWTGCCKGISRKLRVTPFLSSSLVQQELQWWHSKLHAQNFHLNKTRTRAYMIIKTALWISQYICTTLATKGIYPNNLSRDIRSDLRSQTFKHICF